MPTESHTDDDVDAIRELLVQILSLWGNLTVHSREAVGELLERLSAAVVRRDTGSKAVRETLQQLLLNVGTGALATLSDPTRRRLTALTGIALPGRRTPVSRVGDTGPAAQPSLSSESGGDRWGQ
jgi:hypothetical protein